ncbi:MAG: hypothetical protein EOO32_01315 [Comamonadaceae bacterium]|nr:MAG: hypothetical protein EOO32_01315 [Comamonadaceae bacterium]
MATLTTYHHGVRVQELSGVSSVALNGVVGIAKDMRWDLQSPDTEAGLLNAAGITTLIEQNGYRSSGSRATWRGSLPNDG